MAKPNMYETPCSHKDLNRLQTEIIAITPQVGSILLIGTILRVQSLTVLDQTARDDVDNTIANFVDIDPEDKVPLIYSLAKSEATGKHHHNINYKKELIQALIPKRTVVQGEVQQVVWYRDMDGATPINPVIKVSIVYTRDPGTDLPIYRITTREWYNVDGTLNSEAKNTMKYYFVNPSDQIDEGHRRRGLLVKSIQMPVMQMMIESLTPLGITVSSVMLKGRQFLDDYEEEFNRFVDNSSTITNPADSNFGKKSVIVKLEEESRTEVTQWFDSAPASLGGATTIRQYLIAEFDI